MGKTNKQMVTAYTCIELLWQKGSFKEGQSLGRVLKLITEKWGHNLPPADISKALRKASFLRRTGRRGKFQYIQKVSPVSKRVADIEENLFSKEFIAKLGKDFETEIDDLRLNFGTSGTCTAFLLRKILEKLIYKVMVRHKLAHLIEDRRKPDRLVGLDAMVKVVSQQKINGVHCMMPKTADNIQGIKFLGDAAAHNPLTNVKMESITPQLPFIITAYEELVGKL